MKTVLQRTLLIAWLGLGAHTLLAQGAPAESVPKDFVPSTSLQEQFVFLKEESSTYKDKKIIREVRLNRFWSNVRDSLAQVQQQLNAVQARVNTYDDEIDSLNKKIEAQQQAVDASEHASTHINVLGINMLKGSFLSFFWITASVLALLLLIALYQYRNSRQVTSKTQYNLRAIQRELEDFRKKSLEKERKLRRELQTERNRVEELKLVASQKR